VNGPFDLVLPDDPNLPTSSAKGSHNLLITTTISPEFFYPESVGQYGLPGREPPPVPKIAVQKNRPSRSRQCDIRFAEGASGVRLKVQAPLTELTKYIQLELSPRRFNAAHQSAALRFRQAIPSAARGGHLR
jgi:hypothetical protein